MAPVLLVNNKKMHDYMTNEKLDRLIGGIEMRWTTVPTRS